jgi:hypothetical protein
MSVIEFCLIWWLREHPRHSLHLTFLSFFSISNSWWMKWSHSTKTSQVMQTLNNKFWGFKTKQTMRRRIWNLLFNNNNSNKLIQFSFSIPTSNFRFTSSRSYCTDPSRILNHNRPGSFQHSQFLSSISLSLYSIIPQNSLVQDRLFSTKILLIKGSCNMILTKKLLLLSFRIC